MKRSSTRPRFEVTVDTRNTVNHAGSAGLVELADRIGLTKGWSWAMAETRTRRSAHDPGRVLRDLVVMLADGGDCPICRLCGISQTCSGRWPPRLPLIGSSSTACRARKLDHHRGLGEGRGEDAVFTRGRHFLDRPFAPKDRLMDCPTATA